MFDLRFRCSPLISRSQAHSFSHWNAKGETPNCSKNAINVDFRGVLKWLVAFNGVCEWNSEVDGEFPSQPSLRNCRQIIKLFNYIESGTTSWWLLIDMRTTGGTRTHTRFIDEQQSTSINRENQPSRISQKKKIILLERFSIVDSVERRRNPRWSERAWNKASDS